jgi:hypothetical protein
MCSLTAKPRIDPGLRVRSEEEAAERPRKPVPAWARRCVGQTPGRASLLCLQAHSHSPRVVRSEALAPVLYAQAKADPDAIFQNPARTCRCASMPRYADITYTSTVF